MDYEYKFSVVMPIYNVEKYLAEAIDSLIDQTIGFEENVELLIIDDGSPDNSKDIALEYQEKYPENIKFFSKLNGGQASAFNLGLKHLHGKYVSFLDSDDRLSPNTFQEVYDFFEKHYDEIDLVAIPVLFFERRTGDHALNYKFRSTRVIDLMKQPHNPQLSVASSFVKNESLEGKEFDTELISGYDTVMVNRIILPKKKIGVISTSSYFYRKRMDETSMIDNYKGKKKYFTHTLKNLNVYLIDYYMERMGCVPKFIQYVIAYNLQWYKGVSDFPDYFTDEEINEFWETFCHALSYVDEDVINDKRIIKQNIVRYFLMYIKNKKEFHIETVDGEGEVYLKTGDFIINNLHNHGIYLDSIEIESNILKILGTFASSCDYDTLSIQAIKTDSDGTKEVFHDLNEFTKENSSIKRFLGVNWQYKRYFNLEIPIIENEEAKLEFEVIYNENDKTIVMKNDIHFRDTSMVDDRISYSIEGSHIISFNENSFSICPYSREKAYELKNDLHMNIQELLQTQKDLEKEIRSLNKEINKLNKKNSELENKNEKLNDKNDKLNEQNKNLKNHNRKLKENLKKSRQKNKEIVNSTSWKVTKPLRMPKQVIKKLED